MLITLKLQNLKKIHNFLLKFAEFSVKFSDIWDNCKEFNALKTQKMEKIFKKFNFLKRFLTFKAIIKKLATLLTQ